MPDNYMKDISSKKDMHTLAKYYKAVSKLSIEQKSQIVMQLNENARSLIKSCLKMQHPEWNDQQIVYEIIRLLYGLDVEAKGG